jgi:hypothetical protein
MKTWLVRVYCDYGEEIYVAYDESNPIENGHICSENLCGIYEYLWDSYGYILTDHTDADPEGLKLKFMDIIFAMKKKHHIKIYYIMIK